MYKKILLFENFISLKYSIYHSTDKDALFAILFQNRLAGITPQEIDNKMYRGVSCTKDKNFNYKNNDVTIELDAEALSKKWKLVNIDFFSTEFGKSRLSKHELEKVDEKEVFVITGNIDSEKSIQPLSKYILSIKLNKKGFVLSDDIKEILNANFSHIKIYNHLGKDITKTIVNKRKSNILDSDYLDGNMGMYFDDF